MEEYADAESKGVKAHFRMDESGVIRLESAEATFQREVIEEVKEDADKDKKKADAPDFDKGTLDALKDKFKDFFNGDGDNEEEARKVLEELANAKKEEEAAKEEEAEKTEEQEETAEEEKEPKVDEEEEKKESGEEAEKTEEKEEETKEGEEKKDEKVEEEVNWHF